MQALEPGHMAGTVTRTGSDPGAKPGSHSAQGTDHGALSQSLATEAVSAFGAVVEQMGRIRELHGEICGNLDRFADLVGAADSGDTLIVTLEEDVQQLGTALGRFCDLAVSPDARGRLRSARGQLASIDKCGHVLTAIASLMGTTIASLGLENLETFIEELRQTATSIQVSAETVANQLIHLDDRGRQLLTSCNQASYALGGMPSRIAGPRDALSRLSAEEARAAGELSDRARGLTRDGRAHLNSFVTAMQFSDRLAQRLDHLAAMSRAPDGHVARLAAAQARRCAQDINEVSRDVRATIKLLADLGHAGARVFSEGQLAETIREALTARADLTQIVTAELSAVQTVVETARSEAAHAAEMASSTAESFDGLKIASKNLALASFNSMLVSNRYSHASGPMKVLSKEVRQIASDCLAAVDQARSMIAEITVGSETAQADLVSATETLQGRTADARDQTEAGEQRLGEMNEMRQTSGICAQSLLLMVDAVTDSMGRVEQVGATLAQFAQSIENAWPVDGAPDAARINAIRDSYTMEEERQVHAQVFSGVPGIEVALDPAPATAPQGGDDSDIDDLLF